jgi:outer membrane protein assembly factor BamA
MQHRIRGQWSQLRWLLPLLALLLVACSPVRRLPKDHFLLERNSIKGNTSKIPDAELQTYLKQKPNRKILGLFRFHLQTYSLVRPKRFETRYANRVERRKVRNEQRKAAGKKPRSEEPLSLAKWFREVGEAPVAYDAAAAHRSAAQLQRFLQNRGYFNATVRDTAQIDSSNRRASVRYLVNAGTPYRYNEIRYIINNPTIRELFMSKWAYSMPRKGEIYNADLLDLERDRITALLKNEGYYAFVKNYVNFSADSSIGNHMVNLSLIISDPVKRVPGTVDSTIEVPHIRYRIRNIYVTSDYVPLRDSTTRVDTLYFDDVHYLSNRYLQFKPRTLKGALPIRRGDLYSKDASDLAYRKISEFNAFKFINLNYQPIDSLGLLDLNVRLSPRPRQSYILQTQGTNTAGNLGVSLNLIYQNRNMLRGLELFELRLNAGLEVQRILGTPNDEGVAGFLPFNTLLLGPEASLVIPKVPRLLNFLGTSNRKTRIASYFNYQRRPDYQRSIFTSIYGFSARTGKRIAWILNPVEVNYVTVDLSTEFNNLLNSSNNLFLKNSFRSQFIAASKLSRIYSSQELGSDKSFVFFQWNIESAGAILNGSRSFFQNPGIENGKYIVFGVPYSQYVRFDSDFRFFRKLGKDGSMAFRSITGLGIPYGNSDVMPFEKSFFVGGANGIRSWIARSLGPGGYRDSTGIRIDQIGDIKLEWNLEFRQKIYSIVEGAFFVDAGNIWLRKKDPLRLNAEFDFSRFYREIAVGSGLGVRLNFNYFIIRLDAAHPLCEPYYPQGTRWAFNRLAMKNVNFNFGIGYPF